MKANVADTLLQQVLIHALNPHIQFFIRKIPKYESLRGQMDSRIDLATAINMLGGLTQRTVTGNAAIEYLSVILARLSDDDAKVMERIIEKDLKCGVSDSTANKIWPGLIPSYPVMLASAYDEKLVAKVTWPALAQLKMDGMRFNAIVKNGQCEFRSRNGKLIDIPNAIFQQPFIHMSKYWGIDMVFDGELLIVDVAGKPLDRKTGNGILNKAVKGTMSEEEAEHVRATLWDAIPLENFNEGVYKERYRDRVAKLSNALSNMRGLSAFGHLVDLVKQTEVKDLDEAQKVFLKYLDEGQEGIILKDYGSIWEDKRSKGSIKFKGENECDLRIIGWEEGTGKNVGRLGALRCATECGQLVTGLGTGFNDKDRDAIGPDVVGKIVAVKYNAKITDKRTGVHSLFLPVFLEIREDKTIADSLKDLK